MVDQIVYYHPEDDYSTIATAKENVLCQNVLDKIVTYIHDKLFLIRLLFAKGSNTAHSTTSKESAEAEAKSTYYAILEFWCNVIFVDFDTDAVIEYYERMKQAQRLGPQKFQILKETSLVQYQAF